MEFYEPMLVWNGILFTECCKSDLSHLEILTFTVAQTKGVALTSGCEGIWLDSIFFGYLVFRSYMVFHSLLSTSFPTLFRTCQKYSEMPFGWPIDSPFACVKLDPSSMGTLVHAFSNVHWLTMHYWFTNTRYCEVLSNTSMLLTNSEYFCHNPEFTQELVK